MICVQPNSAAAAFVATAAAKSSGVDSGERSAASSE